MKKNYKKLMAVLLLVCAGGLRGEIEGRPRLPQSLPATTRVQNNARLLEVAVNGTAAQVQELFARENGVDPLMTHPNNMMNALHIAAQHGNTSVVRELLQLAPNLKETQWIDGDTALHIAADANRSETVQALLNANANKDARDNFDHTPLHCAAAGNAIRAAGVLIGQGALIDARANEANDRWTPLYIAAREGHWAMYRFLCDRGANSARKCFEGGESYTPYNLAMAMAKVPDQSTEKFTQKLSKRRALWDRACIKRVREPLREQTLNNFNVNRVREQQEYERQQQQRRAQLKRKREESELCVPNKKMRG